MPIPCGADGDREIEPRESSPFNARAVLVVDDEAVEVDGDDEPIVEGMPAHDGVMEKSNTSEPGSVSSSSSACGNLFSPKSPRARLRTS